MYDDVTMLLLEWCSDNQQALQAERSAAQTPAEVTTDPDVAALQDRPRPVLTRRCWVTIPDSPGRGAGLLAEWRQDRAGDGWHRRVVYAVNDGGRRC